MITVGSASAGLKVGRWDEFDLDRRWRNSKVLSGVWLVLGLVTMVDVDRSTVRRDLEVVRTRTPLTAPEDDHFLVTLGSSNQNYMLTYKEFTFCVTFPNENDIVPFYVKSELKRLFRMWWETQTDSVQSECPSQIYTFGCCVTVSAYILTYINLN